MDVGHVDPDHLPAGMAKKELLAPRNYLLVGSMSIAK
jgi:hypothetical protein